MQRFRRLGVLLPFALAACATAGGARPSLLGAGISAEDALARADAAAAADRDGGHALAEAGWVHLVRGQDTDGAVSRWKQAVEKDPAETLALLGLAEAARARLDHAAAGASYLALLERAPADPLAETAAIRLPAVLGTDPATDADALRVLRSLLERPGVSPRVRARARDLVAWLLQQQGELAAAKPYERGGAPAAWAVVGPFSGVSALDRDTRFPPETEGRLRASYDGPLGTVAPRAIPTPDGILALVGEPAGDVYYAAADVTVPAGGTYLLRWRSRAGLRVTVDGVVVLNRDETTALPPERGWGAMTLAPGTHRVLARILRDQGGTTTRLELLDAKGDPAGAWSTARLGEPAPKAAWPDDPTRPGVAAAEVPDGAVAWAQARLARDPGDALAAQVAAMTLFGRDDQAAKVYLQRAVKTAPDFAWARFLEARIAENDPAVPADLRTGRAARLAEVAAGDDGHVAAKLLLARIALQQQRYDDAEPLLAAAAEAAPAAPEVGLTRAQLLQARGLAIPARQAVDEALRLAPHSCSLRKAAFESRRGDGDVHAADAAADLLKTCNGSGLVAWADYRAAQGDLAGAAEAWRHVLDLDPAQISPALRLADLLGDLGRTDEAAQVLKATGAFWPRLATVPKRLGRLYADAGDDARAKTWRERALRLNPSDLSLRSALAWQQGHHLLDWGALDLTKAIADYEARGDGAEAGADSVLVVDHAVDEVFADDPRQPVVVERVQNVTKVLTKKAVDQQGEVSIPDDAEVVAVHVQKPDGRILEPEAIGSGRTSLRGLEIGDYVVVDFVVSRGPRAPAMPGWTASAFYVQVFGTAVGHSSYVARAPVSLGLQVDARNLKVAPPVREGDYLVFRHEAKDLPARQPENDAVGPDEVLPWFQVGAGAGPESYGVVWGDYVASRARVTPEVAAFAAHVVEGLTPAQRKDREAVVRAVATAVDREVRGRTASNQLSDRGTHALVRGRGNRLLATRAVLNALGVPSRVALVRPFQADPGRHRFPAGDLYTYAVLRVDLGEGRHLWLDQNVRGGPIGTLRPMVAGRPALLLADPGRPTKIVETPTFPREDERKDMQVGLALDAQGNLMGKGSETYRGFAAAVIRSSLARVDVDRRRQAVESALTQSFGPLRLLSLEFEGDGEDAAPGTPFVIKYRFRAERYARVDGDRMILPGGSLFPDHLSRRLVRSASRTLPLLLDNETLQHMEVTLALPDGAKVVSGADAASLNSPFGRFERTVKPLDDGLAITEDLALRLARVPPDAYGDLARFAAGVDEVQGRDLVVALPEAVTER